MKIKDLIKEAKITIVSKNDLDTAGTWNPEVFINKSEALKLLKEKGKDELVKFIQNTTKKIGEENYNSIKTLAKNKNINLPDYKVALKTTKLDDNARLIALYDCLSKGPDIIKSRIEETIKELQLKLNKLS